MILPGMESGQDPSVRGVHLDTAAYSVQVHGRRVPLSPRELDLLKMLMDNAGHVVMAATLFHAIWGQDDSRDYRTLKTHILRLRRKIEDDPHAPTYIRTVRGVGYIFDDRPTVGTVGGTAHGARTPGPVSK